MSKEQPPVREVVPYKSGKRASTFRKLNIDFAGTALEQAIAQRDQTKHFPEARTNDDQPETTSSDLTTHHHSPPLPTTHQVATEAELNASKSNLKSVPSKTTHHQSPPLPNRQIPDHSSSAPTKDFNRRANSLERDAMPSGTFPGSSKKVYDALYLRTRGAIIPKKMVRASRRDLLEWTGIRNLKTIDNHIKYLMAVGLIVRHWELGSNEGSGYEVVLPEERNADHSPPLPTTGGDSPPDTTTQKTGSGYTQKLGSGGEGQITENTTAYGNRNTINTNTDDDTHTLRGLTEIMIEAAQSVVGEKLTNTEQEQERWNELARLLAAELKTAAERTDSISSVPAFLTEHLRRQLSRKTRTPEPIEVFDKRPEQINVLHPKSVEETSNATNSLEEIRGVKTRSSFTLEECQRYAKHLHATGQGITNPGGYATTIYRTGEADEMIAKFLNPATPAKSLDTSQCPDCQGTGWWYPKGREMGAAKCKHEKLNNAAVET